MIPKWRIQGKTTKTLQQPTTLCDNSSTSSTATAQEHTHLLWTHAFTCSVWQAAPKLILAETKLPYFTAALTAAAPWATTSRPSANVSSSKWCGALRAWRTSTAALLMYVLVTAVWKGRADKMEDSPEEHARCRVYAVSLSSIWETGLKRESSEEQSKTNE